MTSPLSPASAGGSKSRRASRVVTTPLLRTFVAGHPVSTNQMYGSRGGAAKHLTPAAWAWRESVALSTMRWRYAAGAKRPNLAVSCVFSGVQADVDNLLKLTLDGLKDGLMVDDRYITRVCAERLPYSRNDEKGAWIEVRELPSEPTKPAQQRPTRKRNKVERSA